MAENRTFSLTAEVLEALVRVSECTGENMSEVIRRLILAEDERLTPPAPMTIDEQIERR